MGVRIGLGNKLSPLFFITPWDNLFTETDFNDFKWRQSFVPSQKFECWNMKFSGSIKKCFPLFRPLLLPCFLPCLEMLFCSMQQAGALCAEVSERELSGRTPAEREGNSTVRWDSKLKCCYMLYIGPQAGTRVPFTGILPWNPRSRPLYLYTLQASGEGCHQKGAETLGKMPLYPWASGGLDLSSE